MDVDNVSEKLLKLCSSEEGKCSNQLNYLLLLLIEVDKELLQQYLKHPDVKINHTDKVRDQIVPAFLTSRHYRTGQHH